MVDDQAGCGAGSSRSRNSRWSRSMLAVRCSHTDAADKYQIQRSSKPGRRDMSSTGTDTSRIRPNEVIKGGMVLPIAWNMLEATKMMPDPMKFQAEMRRYSLTTAMTSGSLE